MKHYVPFSQVAMGDTCWLVDAITGAATTKVMRIGNAVGGAPAVNRETANPFKWVTVTAAALEPGTVAAFTALPDGKFCAGQVLMLDQSECVMVEAPDESQALLNRAAAERAAAPPVCYRYNNNARFMYTVRDSAHMVRSSFATGRELIAANPHDPGLLEWVRRAEVDGEPFLHGGGASPAVTFWRIE